EGQSNEDSQTPNSDPQLPNTEPETEQALKVDGAGFGLLIYKNGRIETENISLVTNTDKQHGTEEIIDLRDFIGVSVADASAEDYVLFEGSPSDYTGLPSEAGGLYTSSNIVHLESGKSIVLSNAKGIFFTDGNTDYLPEGFTSEEIEIPGSTADEPMAASMMSFGVDADDGDSLEAFSLTDSMSLADDTNSDSDDILSDGEDWDFDALSLDDEREGGSDTTLASLDSADVSGEDSGDADISDLVSGDDQFIPGLEPDDTVIKD